MPPVPFLVLSALTPSPLDARHHSVHMSETKSMDFLTSSSDPNLLIQFLSHSVSKSCFSFFIQLLPPTFLFLSIHHASLNMSSHKVLGIVPINVFVPDPSYFPGLWPFGPSPNFDSTLPSAHDQRKHILRGWLRANS